MENNLIPEDVQSLFSLFGYDKFIWLLLGFFWLWVTSYAVNFVAKKATDYMPQKRFLILQIKTLISFIIYIGGTGLLLVYIIQPPREVLLAAAGSMAVAIGFALKDIASSLIAGIILLFDTPFKVGDRITFDGTYGEIVTIGLRSIKINTLDDNIVTIPNSRFINDAVASGNFGALDMMIVCDFHVAFDNDFELIRNIIHEVIVTSRFVYLKKDISFTFNEIIIHDRVAMQIQSKAYVMDINYEKAFQSDIITRVNMLFLEHDIKRP